MPLNLNAKERQIPVRKTAPAPVLDSLKIKNLVCASLDGDKAEDIEVIPLADQSALADYMVIASGSSARHVSALADKLIDRLVEAGVKDVRTEGARQGDWVVVDIGDVIVHVFRPEVREFYNIEKMWRAMPLMSASSPAAT